MTDIVYLNYSCFRHSGNNDNDGVDVRGKKER